MKCRHQIIAYRSRSGSLPNGKWPLVFNLQQGYKELPVSIPCGKCIPCRLNKTREWGVRCMHEAKMHDNNAFVTLTYNEQNVNKNYSLVKEDFTKFIKQARYNYGKLRYFHCGEYGENFNRPHHHACLFGINIQDKELFTIKKGIKIYTSEKLTKIWGHGFTTISDVTFESACYVASYIQKKIGGEMADSHYQGREPEYVTMSKKPGIGAEFVKSYQNDIYKKDKVIIDSKIILRPPRYYDKLYEALHPDSFKSIHERRQLKNVKTKQQLNNEYERRPLLEEYDRYKQTFVKRFYEENQK
ncbi:MAG: replication initiator protein [Microvirus sp.]|nr:MAG: replication initiator protein [Microvirus sp.]